MKKFQTIYLGIEDDISLVVDHLAQADALNIVFVIPKNAEIFSSIINFRLLKREAENFGKNISIITADKTGRYLAKRADILLADELQGIESLLEEEQEKSVSRQVKTKATEKIVSSPAERAVIREGGATGGTKPKPMADIVAPSARPPAPSRTKKEDVFSEQEKSTIEEKVDDFFHRSRNIDLEKDSGLIKEKQELSEVSDESVFLPEEPAYNVFDQRSWQPNSDFLPEKRSDLGFGGRAEGFAPAETSQISIDFQRDKLDKEFELKKSKKAPQKIFKKITWLFLTAGLLVAAIAGYFIIPSATIALTPKKEIISFSSPITADKNITKVDYALKKIPAQIIRVEKSETKEFIATGAGGSGSKARGTITIYNEFSSAPQTLVATTRFISATSGKTFRIINSVVVPGAKTENGKIVASLIDAEVIADAGGTDYNISPSDFSIPGFAGTPKYEKFYGKSKTAMSGGSSGGAKTISEDDISNAQKAILSEFAKSQNNALDGQVASNLKLFQEAARQEEPEVIFSASSGTAAEKFIATIKLKSIALVFDEKHMSDLADRLISSYLGDKRRAIENTRQIEYSKIQVNFEKGQMVFTAKISQEAVWKINISDLKEKILGKNEADIRKILGQMQGIANAKISFWPFWVKSMPGQADKIKATIDESEK